MGGKVEKYCQAFQARFLYGTQSETGIIAKRSEASFTQEKNSEGKLTGLMMPKIGSRPPPSSNSRLLSRHVGYVGGQQSAILNTSRNPLWYNAVSVP